MPNLLLTANRQGYGIDQLDNTMSVMELISLLDQYPQDTKIYLKHDDGYTYGCVREEDFQEEETNE